MLMQNGIDLRAVWQGWRRRLLSRQIGMQLPSKQVMNRYGQNKVNHVLMCFVQVLHHRFQYQALDMKDSTISGVPHSHGPLHVWLNSKVAQGPHAACLWQVQQMELDMENQRSIMLGEVATMREGLQVRSAGGHCGLGVQSATPVLEPGTTTVRGSWGARLACQDTALLMGIPCLLLPESQSWHAAAVQQPHSQVQILIRLVSMHQESSHASNLCVADGCRTC